MPKAVSGKLSSAVRPAAPTSASRRPDAKGGKSSGAGGEGSSGGRNHLFNTEKFGQHILMNPLVAQG